MKGIASGMVKTVVIRKRNIIMHGIIILVLAVASIVLRTYLTDNSRNQDYITYAQAAKMISYAQIDDCDAFSHDMEWYKTYMEYVNINGYMNAANPNSYVKYKDVSMLARRINADIDCFKSEGIESYIDIENDNRPVKNDVFIRCFQNLCKYFKYGDEIELKQMGVSGVPSDNVSEEWTVCTTKGTYIYDGVIIQPYVDTTIEALVRQNRLLCVVDKISDDVKYRNVLLKTYENGYVTVNVYGMIKKYKVHKVEVRLTETHENDAVPFYLVSVIGSSEK